MIAEGKLQFADFSEGDAVTGVKHVPTEGGGKVLTRMRDQLRAQGASAPGDCRDDSVNAIRRSAGHEADDQLLAVFRFGWSLHAATLEQFFAAEKLNSPLVAADVRRL